MKQDVYLVIFQITRNEIISYILSNIIYMFMCIVYLVKKIFHKKKVIEINYSTAYKIIENVCPEKELQINICNKEIDSSIDLSIIIPVFNYENVISKNINSVINQNTKYKFEIIIVDDGSNEETKTILKSFEHMKNIKLIYQNNMGISGARNTGINNAVGKYIMFVDCDDYVKDNCVQILLDEAYRTGNDIIIGAHELVKENHQQELSRRRFIYPYYNLMNYRDNDYIMNFSGLPWAKVYKRDIFKDIRFPEGYWYEDTIVQFLCFRKAKTFSYIPIVVYEYKWYEGNYSKVQIQNNTRVIEHFWIVKKMIEENDRLGLKRDVILYKTVLRHLGSYLYHPIKKLDEEIINALFIMSKNLLEEVYPKEKYHLNFQMHELEKAFRENDIDLWKLVCKNI